MPAFPQEPTLKNPATIEKTYIISALKSQSIAGITQTRLRGPSYTRFSLFYPLLTQADYNTLQGFYASVNGILDTFTFIEPLKETPQGSNLGTPLIDGASQTGNQINTKGWDVLESGLLLPGDLLTISGDLKVYTITENVNSDSNGDAIIKINPSLLLTPSDNAAITTTNVQYTCRMDDTSLESITSHPNYHELTINFSEIINAVGV